MLRPSSPGHSLGRELRIFLSSWRFAILDDYFLPRYLLLAWDTDCTGTKACGGAVVAESGSAPNETTHRTSHATRGTAKARARRGREIEARDGHTDTTDITPALTVRSGTGDTRVRIQGIDGTVVLIPGRVLARQGGTGIAPKRGGGGLAQHRALAAVAPATPTTVGADGARKRNADIKKRKSARRKRRLACLYCVLRARP